MAKQILKLSKLGDVVLTEPIEIDGREREILSHYLSIRNKYFQLMQAEKKENEVQKVAKLDK